MMGPERCVCCGAIIPEGRQVCPRCMTIKTKKERKKMCKIGKWVLDFIELLLVFLLMIVALPIVIIDDIVMMFRRKKPEDMTDEERRWYYGYDREW